MERSRLRDAALLVILGLSYLLGCPPTAQAQVPAILQFQGRMLVGSSPFDGAGVFKFALVDGLDSSVLWLSSVDGNHDGQPDAVVSVAVTKGLYSILLGDVSLPNMAAVPLAVFTHPDVRLRVWFNDGANGFSLLSPDQRLAASGYALMAATVPVGSISVAQLASGTLAAANITGTFTPAQLPADLTYKSTDLAAATNALIASLQATNTALSARIDALTSDQTVLSTDPADAALLARGLVQVASFPAPSWVNGPTTGQPSARSGHSTVWTGSELIAWGGSSGVASYLKSGGRHAPAEETWSSTATFGAPTGRLGHTAVWTGSEMIVWGGFDGTDPVNSGGRYTTSPEAWQATAASLDAPSARHRHLALWTGARMVVWGGLSGLGVLGDGALYSPDDGQWAALPSAGAPSPRVRATAVWTGSLVIVWGGEGDSSLLGDGAILPIGNGGTTAGTWESMSSVGAPSARADHTAIWTGTRMIVWGGQAPLGGRLADGGMFNVGTGAWSPMASAGAPSARAKHSAAWTGSEMIVFGGEGSSGALSSGAAYRPATDSWRPLTLQGSPVARSGAGVVWSGSELLVIGGLANGSPLAALQRLDPQPSWQVYRKP